VRSARTLGLALLAVLRIVLKLFVVKENLLACGKDKFRAAVDALKHSICEFHGRLPSQGLPPRTVMDEDAPFRIPASCRNAIQGPGPHQKIRAVDDFARNIQAILHAARNRVRGDASQSFSI
jgi:hypothetical protein